MVGSAGGDWQLGPAHEAGAGLSGDHRARKTPKSPPRCMGAIPSNRGTPAPRVLNARSPHDLTSGLLSGRQGKFALGGACAYFHFSARYLANQDRQMPCTIGFFNNNQIAHTPPLPTGTTTPDGHWPHPPAIRVTLFQVKSPGDVKQKRQKSSTSSLGTSGHLGLG